MSAARGRPLPVPEGGFRRIAVLRLSSLGDVVLTLPTVVALRAAFPAAEIAYWVKEEYADLVREHPALTRVRVLEKDARRLEDLVSMSAELEDHDLVLDLHGSARTRVLTFRQKAIVLRVPSTRLQRERWVRARWSRPAPLPPVWQQSAPLLAQLGLSLAGPPRLHPSAAASAWAAQEWAAMQLPARTIALAPGAAWATKRWPEAHWCALEAALAERGLGRLVLSTVAERRALPVLAAQLASRPGGAWVTESLARGMALMARAAAAVTHDSGLMHVAAASGLPVVALFGGTHPALGFAPAGSGHAVLCREEPCQPCALHGREACPLGHHRCMTALAPVEVVAALERVLAAIDA